MSLETRLALAIGLIDNLFGDIAVELTNEDYALLERRAGKGVTTCHGYPIKHHGIPYSCVTYTSRCGQPVTISLPASE